MSILHLVLLILIAAAYLEAYPLRRNLMKAAITGRDWPLIQSTH
jgi:hypothetical protein